VLVPSPFVSLSFFQFWARPPRGFLGRSPFPLCTIRPQPWSSGRNPARAGKSLLALPEPSPGLTSLGSKRTRGLPLRLTGSNPDAATRAPGRQKPPLARFTAAAIVNTGFVRRTSVRANRKLRSLSGPYSAIHVHRFPHGRLTGALAPLGRRMQPFRHPTVSAWHRVPRRDMAWLLRGEILARI
jgi:hypothetical protein